MLGDSQCVSIMNYAQSKIPNQPSEFMIKPHKIEYSLATKYGR